jgi:hypothetical protein
MIILSLLPTVYPTLPWQYDQKVLDEAEYASVPTIQLVEHVGKPSTYPCRKPRIDSIPSATSRIMMTPMSDHREAKP